MRQYFAFYFLKKWREPILNVQGPCLQTVWYSVQTQVGDLHNLCVADPVGLEQYICLDESLLLANLSIVLPVFLP